MNTLTEEHAVIIERARYSNEENEVFSGDIYTDRTRLKDGQVSLKVVKGLRTHLAKFFSDDIAEKLKPKFIIGYKLNTGGLFYEVWYSPSGLKDEQYSILSKNGRVIDDDSTSLNQALDKVISIVRKSVDESNREIRGDKITSLLESSIYTSSMLNKAFNSQVTQYDTTRLNKHKINTRFLRMFGLVKAKLVFPNKTLKVKGKFNKLRSVIGLGKIREASFITGFSYNSAIDIEVWMVEDNSKTRDEFYVYNLSTGDVIASGLATLRDSYVAIATHLRATEIEG